MSVNTIATSILLASVSYVQPSAAPSYLEPIAITSYMQPEARVSYIEVQVTAEVTFPDVLAVDIVTPTDLVSLSTTKSFADETQGFTDATTTEAVKGLSDSVEMLDSADIEYWIDKHLADLQDIADQHALQTSKPFIDSTSATDIAALNTTKNLADSIGAPTEYVARVIYKSLADSFSFTDAAAAFKLFIREFEDTLSVPDEDVLAITQPKAEVATASDFSSLGVDKGFTEGLSLIDDMDGDIEYAFVKVIGELVTGSDSQVIDFTANKADNISTGSAGVVVMQDYCDITYFLTDYVGTSRTFT